MTTCGLDLKVIELTPAQVQAEQFPNSVKYDIKVKEDGSATCTPVLWWDDASYIAYQSWDCRADDAEYYYVQEVEELKSKLPSSMAELYTLTHGHPIDDFWPDVCGDKIEFSLQF